jgi:arginine N-succinyltransferase
LRTVRESRPGTVARLCSSGDGLVRSLVASGRLADFRAWIGHVGAEIDGCALPAGEAAAMGVAIGDEVRHVGF